jgi:hypothetical protein
MRTFSPYIGEEKHGTEPCDFILEGFSGPTTFIAGLWGIVRPMSCSILFPKCPCTYDKLDRGPARLFRG